MTAVVSDAWSHAGYIPAHLCDLGQPVSSSLKQTDDESVTSLGAVRISERMHEKVFNTARYIASTQLLVVIIL